MPITLHSLFEMTDGLNANEMFSVRWEDKGTVMMHHQIAEFEKHYLKNFYVYNTIKTTKMTIYECVALPYNYK